MTTMRRNKNKTAVADADGYLKAFRSMRSHTNSAGASSYSYSCASTIYGIIVAASILRRLEHRIDGGRPPWSMLLLLFGIAPSGWRRAEEAIARIDLTILGRSSHPFSRAHPAAQMSGSALR
jgi:hypothetical protein